MGFSPLPAPRVYHRGHREHRVKSQGMDTERRGRRGSQRKTSRCLCVSPCVPLRPLRSKIVPSCDSSAARLCALRDLCGQPAPCTFRNKARSDILQSRMSLPLWRTLYANPASFRPVQNTPSSTTIIAAQAGWLHNRNGRLSGSGSGIAAIRSTSF